MIFSEKKFIGCLFLFFLSIIFYLLYNILFIYLDGKYYYHASHDKVVKIEQKIIQLTSELVLNKVTNDKVEIKSKKYIINSVPKNKIIRSNKWGGHFASINFNSVVEKIKLQDIKDLLRVTMTKLPPEHLISLENLEIINKKHDSRGLANFHKIILNTASIESSEELISVFVHEMGHVYDLGYLEGLNGEYTDFFDNKIPILTDDPSLEFYKISWDSSLRKKNNSNRIDFVSGYARSDVFEDFAETYVFYRLHGENFRSLIKESVILQQKYDFMRNKVFMGKEFQKNIITMNNALDFTIWDVTLEQFDIKQFIQ